MFACWEPDGTARARLGLPPIGARRALVLGGARPARRAAAARRRVGRPARAPTRCCVKAHGLWAEHVCDAPMRAVDGRQRDATPSPSTTPTTRSAGPTAADRRRVRPRVVRRPAARPAGRPTATRRTVSSTASSSCPAAALHLTEVPARRWHRWGDRSGRSLLPAPTPTPALRAPFAFPDGTVADWVLTPDGWRLAPARRSDGRAPAD